jgi:hypothetical protein
MYYTRTEGMSFEVRHIISPCLEYDPVETADDWDDYYCRYGCLANSRAQVVRDDLKKVLEKEGLSGLRFNPIQYQWIRGGPDGKTLPPHWMLGSTVTMPPTLTPMVATPEDQDADPIVYPKEYELIWPEELEYDADEVAKLGPFDIAQGRERFYLPCFWREILVSQRFREVFEKLSIGGCDFQPVRLTRRGG